MVECLFLMDGPSDGAWNMAVDQVLLAHAEETGLTILRFYEWSPATLSLGYFQRAVDRFSHHASRELQLVRRTTGGGAIVHDRELTYSLCLPGQDRWSQKHREVYELVHGAILEILAGFDIKADIFQKNSLALSGHVSTESSLSFLCFQRRSPGDLVLRNEKIAGSAQRRGRHSLLQHGSILLAKSSFAPELPGILELTRKEFLPKQFANLLGNLLADRLKLKLRHVNLSESLQNRAQKVREETFLAGSWTHNR